MSGSTITADRRESQILPPVVAAAALALAAGVLAVGALLPGGDDGDHPADGRVHPGKVSVLGRAKVRGWSGQTFSVQIPLRWHKVIENPATHVYSWAQPAPGASLGSSAAVAQAAGDWAGARRVARTRITLQIEPSTRGRDAEATARAFSRSDVRYTQGFLDLGPVRFGPTAWRFDVAVAGTVESHYFFATCVGQRRRETWHVTVDRSALHGQAAAAQSQSVSAVFASLRTTFPGSTSASPDCVSAGS